MFTKTRSHTHIHTHTHTHTYTHTQLLLSYSPRCSSSTECLFVFWLHSPCAPSDRGWLPTTTTPSVCVCVCVCVCVSVHAGIRGWVCVCVKSWGVCLQCWEPHLHTLTCVQSLSSAQFRLTQLSAFLSRASDGFWPTEGFICSQPDYRFRSEKRTVWKKNASVESDCLCASFCLSATVNATCWFFTKTRRTNMKKFFWKPSIKVVMTCLVVCWRPRSQNTLAPTWCYHFNKDFLILPSSSDTLDVPGLPFGLWRTLPVFQNASNIIFICSVFQASVSHTAQ